MTNTSSLLTLLLSLSACGAVASSDPPSGDDDPGAPDGGPPMPAPDASGLPPPALAFEGPRAATTPAAISLMGKANRQGVVDFMKGTTSRDVSEQPFVTTRDEAVTVTIAFAALPSVAASRKIETQVITDATGAVNVRCTSGGGTILLDAPECNTDAVMADHSEVTTTSLTAKWTLGIYDVAAQTMVPGCTPVGSGISCTLPASKGHAYRVITSLTNVNELWDGTPVATYFQGPSYFFIGRADNPALCTQMQTVANGDSYCKQRTAFSRSVGLDTASMAFGDIAVAVTADGATSMMPAAALTWSYGDEDLPGPTF